MLSFVVQGRGRLAGALFWQMREADRQAA